MEILAANHSSYPRIGESQEKQLLRQSYAKLEKGEISADDFAKVQDDVTREVIEEQVKAGLDWVADGQIRWNDPISHLARGLDGCEINGLLRFFDTNFYFRQPVLKGKLSRKQPVLERDYKFSSGVSKKPLKAVLTGPYTLARHSINKRGEDFKTVLGEFTAIVAQEIKDLEKAGARLIQVEEPAILKNRADFGIFRESVESLSKAKGQADLALYTYFGDAEPIYEELLTLPVDLLGFDLTYSLRLPNKISKIGCEKDLGVGVIDGRNTKMERKEEILALLKEVLPKISSERVFVSPSCGLGDYLPREVAFKKLQLIAEIVKEAGKK